MSSLQKIIILSESQNQEDSPESIIIIPKPRPLPSRIVKLSKIRLVVTKPGRPKPRLVLIETAINPKKILISMVMDFLSSKKAHQLLIPILPNVEVLKGWADNWEYVPKWLSLHSESCVKFESGDWDLPKMPSALPRVIMQRIALKNKFGLMRLSSKGLSTKDIMERLTNQFPDHDHLINLSGGWSSMIYVFFHVPLGKLYIGSFNRKNERWVRRSQEHFSDALKMSRGGTPSELCFVLRTSALTDWRIFGLQNCFKLRQPCTGIEGFWISSLNSIQPHGFNGNIPSIRKNSVVEKNPALQTSYIEEVKHALERHRNTLKLFTAPSHHIDHTVQNVVKAFSVLQLELQRGEPRFLNP